MKWNTSIVSVVVCFLWFVPVAVAQLEPIWQDIPWSQGGLTPTGPIWSLDGMFDFDQDGQGEFFLSSSWGGPFGIDAMLYEYQPSGAYQIIWYTWFHQLDLTNGNYSVMTHCDLDNDQLPELAVFLDAPAGKDCLYLYEYDPLTGLFPSVPTTSWDLTVTGGIDEAGAIVADDIDHDGTQELVLYFYAAAPAAAHLMVIQLEEGTSLADPVWTVEMDDATTFAYYGYCLKITDLDGDELKEIIVVEWNYCRMVIYEDNGLGTFTKVNDLFLTFEPLAFSTDGAAEVDVDQDGLKELYLVSTAGYLWVVQNQGDISQITFADHFRLIHDFMAQGGHVPTQLKVAESPDPNLDPALSLYLATTEVNEIQSDLFEIAYSTGDVTQPSNYTITSIFNETRQGDELFKIAKFGFGDSNGNGQRDFVVGSFSLAMGKPHVMVLEEEATVSDQDTPVEPPGDESDNDPVDDDGPSPPGQGNGKGR